jgi:hypothetical protein
MERYYIVAYAHTGCLCPDYEVEIKVVKAKTKYRALQEVLGNANYLTDEIPKLYSFENAIKHYNNLGFYVGVTELSLELLKTIKK